MSFYLKENIYPEIMEVLEAAQEYIYIAMFQFQSNEFIDKCIEKQQHGVRVEVFTLPIESVNSQNRNTVLALHTRMMESGCHIFECKWNIGDPERTSTANNVWFSFHGKFIVTDNSAIILSANFLEQNELDACIIIREEPLLIQHLCEKFDYLKAQFIDDIGRRTSNVRAQILSALNHDPLALTIPDTVQNQRLEGYWIRHYPDEILQNRQIEDSQLLICPFDAKARDVYYNIINEAEEYIYLIAETLTDLELQQKLISKKCRNGIQVIILCGDRVMDNQIKANDQFISLIAAGIMLKTITNLHAKVILTDKSLAIGSINGNKINLGFKSYKNHWRANTETVFISKEREDIIEAKSQIDGILEVAIDIKEKMVLKDQAKNIELFKTYINCTRIASGAKTLISRFVLDRKLSIPLALNKLASLTRKVTSEDSLTKEHLICAMILFYLQHRMQSQRELTDKFMQFDVTSNEVTTSLNTLVSRDFVVLEIDCYLINPREL